MGKSNSKFIYSVPITQHDPNKGETAVYRNPDSVDGLSAKLGRWPEVQTLQDLYLRTFKENSNNKCLGTRTKLEDGTFGPYVFKPYYEVKAICDKVGSAIMNKDLAPMEHDDLSGEDFRFVGIFAKNREEWVEVDIACVFQGITTIPIYDTLGREAMKFVFEQTNLQTVFCSGENIKKLLDGKKSGELPSLKSIISFDPITEDQVKGAEALSMTLVDWKTFIGFGDKLVDYAKVTSESVFTFCYTSGTTSLPKAAMLAHRNSMAMIASADDSDFLGIKVINNTDSYCSYLPLAHVFERNMIPLVLSRGASIGFFSGDVQKIKDDLQILKPTLFISVPRLFSKFFDVIKAKMAKTTGLAGKIAKKAVDAKLSNLKKKNEYKHTIYDSVVFKEPKKALGGKVKICVSGSAPISAEVADFLKVCFSCPVLEGYGSTETCSGIFCQHPNDAIAGHVGGPLGSCEFKLVDIPEMNYKSTDKDEQGVAGPRGEICVRGPFLFRGYYKDEEKTKESIDNDGWLHTGDIGKILPNGALKIIDRKKNIFKLAQGEYVAPEKVENIYLTSKYVSEVFLHGDSFKTACVGMIVPDKKPLMSLAEECKVEGTFEELCKNKTIVDKVLADITKIGKSQGLFGFEQAKKLYLEPVSFVLQDLATPTLKLKRP